MDRPADLVAEDVVDHAVLLDAAEAAKRRRGDRGAKVVATARVILDLGAGARDRLFDPGLKLIGTWHCLQGTGRYTL